MYIVIENVIFKTKQKLHNYNQL